MDTSFPYNNLQDATPPQNNNHLQSSQSKNARSNRYLEMYNHRRNMPESLNKKVTALVDNNVYSRAQERRDISNCSSLGPASDRKNATIIFPPVLRAPARSQNSIGHMERRKMDGKTDKPSGKKLVKFKPKNLKVKGIIEKFSKNYSDITSEDIKLLHSEHPKGIHINGRHIRFGRFTHPEKAGSLRSEKIGQAEDTETVKMTEEWMVYDASVEMTALDKGKSRGEYPNHLNGEICFFC